MWKVKSKISDNLNNISEHLEFLGYEIEVAERVRIASSKFYKTIIFYNYIPESPNVTNFLFQTGVENKKLTFEMYEFINKINVESFLANTHVEQQGQNIRIFSRAVYLGIYSKNLFTEFWYMYNSDIELLCGEEAGKLFIDD